MAEEGGELEEEGSISDEGGEEIRQTRKDEAKYRENQIGLLKMYVDSMMYNVPETPPKATPRLEIIAKPNKKYEKILREDYLQVLSPKERAQRIKKKADDNFKFVTVEDLQERLREYERYERAKLKARKHRDRMFNDIIQNLKKRWHEYFMIVVIDKFAAYMSKRFYHFNSFPVTTESAQRLIRGLVCNMFLALGIDQAPYCVDQSMYETLGFILADLLLDALFLAQFQPDPAPEKPPPRLKCEPLKPKESLRGKPRSEKSESKEKGKSLPLPKLPQEFLYLLELNTRKFNECKKRN